MQIYQKFSSLALQTDGGRLLVEESWRRMIWLQKEWVLVLVGAGGRWKELGEEGREWRKDRVLGDERGGAWKMKTGGEGEESGEDRTDIVEVELGDIGSKPEREEEEPET